MTQHNKPYAELPRLALKLNAASLVEIEPLHNTIHIDGCPVGELHLAGYLWLQAQGYIPEIALSKIARRERP